MTTELSRTIDQAWEQRETLSSSTKGAVREAVDEALRCSMPVDARGRKIPGRMARASMAEEGGAPVIPPERHGGDRGRPGGAPWWDKVPSKFLGWSDAQFREAGFRAVPGAVVRRSAFIAKGAVLMPSFVNVGAYVGENTMVDTWATVGSCAQIGNQCHISGGAGIGGVLEPLQAAPVIIEDNCFIGARSEVAEGVIVGEGSVLSMGVYLGQSTKIVDRATGEVFYGRVPPYSVVVAGALPQGADRPSLYCAVIVKRVDARTRAKTSINELLRD